MAAHAGYGTPAPQAEAMAVAVEVWKDALDEAGVPSEQLRNMLKKCLSGRGSNYPPGVSEICGAWRAHLISLPRETIQETDAARGRALPSGRDAMAERGRELYLQAQKRYAAGRGNVQCDCGWPATLSRDSFDWVCDSKREPCAFRWAVADTFNAPLGKGKAGPMGGATTDEMPPMPADTAPAPKSEYSDGELLVALRDRCNLDEDKIERGAAIEFARRMLKIIAPDFWTPQLAKQEWGKVRAAVSP